MSWDASSSCSLAIREAWCLAEESACDVCILVDWVELFGCSNSFFRYDCCIAGEYTIDLLSICRWQLLFFPFLLGLAGFRTGPTLHFMSLALRLTGTPWSYLAYMLSLWSELPKNYSGELSRDSVFVFLFLNNLL